MTNQFNMSAVLNAINVAKNVIEQLNTTSGVKSSAAQSFTDAWQSVCDSLGPETAQEASEPQLPGALVLSGGLVFQRLLNKKWKAKASRELTWQEVLNFGSPGVNVLHEGIQL